jgi:WD40 repeat protein
MALIGFFILSSGALAEPPQKPIDHKDRSADKLPEGAVARLGTTRFRDGEGFASLAFTPDGKSLYSRGWFGPGITEWDVATGNLLHTIEPNLEFVSEVTLAPDGKTLAAVGKDGLLRVWDSQSGKTVLSLKIGVGVWKVVFSPRGHYLALADRDGGFSLRELPSGKELAGPLDRETPEDRGQTGDSMEIQHIAFSPDDRYLALGRRWQSPLVWDVAQGKLERTTLFCSGLFASLFWVRLDLFWPRMASCLQPFPWT